MARTMRDMMWMPVLDSCLSGGLSLRWACVMQVTTSLSMLDPKYELGKFGCASNEFRLRFAIKH